MPYHTSQSWYVTAAQKEIVLSVGLVLGRRGVNRDITRVIQLENQQLMTPDDARFLLLETKWNLISMFAYLRRFWVISGRGWRN